MSIRRDAILRGRLRRERWVARAVAAAAALVLLAVIGMPAFLVLNAAGSIDNLSTLLPLLVGSLRASMYALLFGFPLAVLAAIWCARFASARLRALIKPLLEVFEAVPSVVLGLVAALSLAPWLAHHVVTVLLFLILAPLLLAFCGAMSERYPSVARRLARSHWQLCAATLALLATAFLCNGLAGMLGNSIASAFWEPATPWNALLIGLVLGVAIVPTVFSIAEDALFGVPASLADGAHALGATRWQTIWRLLLPAASPGLLAALLLGFGRALGETMIVLMASGNTPVLDLGLASGLRTIAANLALEAPIAIPGSAQYRLLLLSAIALFSLCLIVNAMAEMVRGWLRRRYARL
ncbi:MAG: ABC transporter permease subunit [Tahibacter sp.]